MRELDYLEKKVIPVLENLLLEAKKKAEELKRKIEASKQKA